MKKTLLFLCALTVGVPSITYAQVIINEIAWMGGIVSANDEWIELYNQGSETVSLSGWKLLAQDGDPKITLSGAISPGGYFLLERTDDDSAPGVPAGVIYTGGLGNTGETLELFDGSGALADSVAGGENWSLGGDNVAKNTVQRQADNSWITGIPTPGVENTTENTQTNGGDVLGSSTSTPSTTVQKKTTAVGYKQNVFAYAGEDMWTVVGAYAFFEGLAVDAAAHHISASAYQWSFGDGDSDDGKDTAHIYSFPGTYTAVISVASHYQHARDSALVYVTQASVAISAVQYGDDGYIEIDNQSDTPLDVSLWKIRAEYADGRKHGPLFTVPKTTTIAPHARVPFPAAVTKIRLTEKDRVVLVYPNGKEAAALAGSLYGSEDTQ